MDHSLEAYLLRKTKEELRVILESESLDAECIALIYEFLEKKKEE